VRAGDQFDLDGAFAFGVGVAHGVRRGFVDGQDGVVDFAVHPQAEQAVADMLANDRKRLGRGGYP
jgi:hypothetical protein